MMVESLKILTILILLVVGSLFGQDSTIRKDAWGIDILVSMGGVGLGTFYRHEYTDNISGFIGFSISEASDENEVDYIDYYTGETYTPGKINRFLIFPLFIGGQYRLFKDEIVDNFRPYVNAAAGPTMIYVFPYNDDYFSALGNGSPRYTFGGYLGFGAYFGSERSTLMGLNLRYYLIPYKSGIRSMYNKQMKEFGGFFISLSLGKVW